MKTRLFLISVLLAFFVVPVRADTSLTVAPGKQVTFSVAVNGSAPFTYQWQKNAAPIAGATAATYVIPAVAATDTGTYTVVITNLAGSASSDKAVFTVAVLPSGVISISSP